MGLDGSCTCTQLSRRQTLTWCWFGAWLLWEKVQLWHEGPGEGERSFLLFGSGWMGFLCERRDGGKSIGESCNGR